MTRTLVIVTSIHDDFDKRVWRHAVSMADNGFQVHLICPWSVKDRDKLDGVILHPFPRVQRRRNRPIIIPQRIWMRLKPLLKQADIIHFHDIDLLPWMALLALFKPIVYDVHENYADEMLVRDWIPHYLRRPLYWMVHAGQHVFARIVKNVVLVTEAQNKDFRTPINRIVVPNYASSRLLNDVNDDYMEREPTVIFTGAQYVNNGSLLFLEIAKRILEENPRIKFFATDWFESEGFRNRYLVELESRGLQGAVTLLPMVPSTEIVKVLNQATIAVNPVLRVRKQIRAINTKLFEFMAAGIPFVTSDLPYPTSLVGKTGAGLLAQPEDVNTFVRQIRCLIEDREYAQCIGSKGQEAFKESYSWESLIPSLNEYYRQILVND